MAVDHAAVYVSTLAFCPLVTLYFRQSGLASGPQHVDGDEHQPGMSLPELNRNRAGLSPSEGSFDPVLQARILPEQSQVDGLKTVRYQTEPCRSALAAALKAIESCIDSTYMHCSAWRTDLGGHGRRRGGCSWLFM